MRVLVTFALDAEFGPWRRYRKFAETQGGRSTIYSARLDGMAIDVLLTGIGGKHTRLESMERFQNGNMDLCISCGTAGALRPDYRIGQVLVAKEVRSAGMPGSIAADELFLQAAVKSGATEVHSFYTVDHVIVSATEKQELGRNSDVVEMESFDVLHQAAALGAKVIAIRGISDLAHENLPLDFNRVTTASGRISLARVLAEIAMHPTSLPSLVRFGQHSKDAAESLARFLDRYMQALAVISNQAVS
jgi:nucleoside phosphorylase